MDNFVKFLQQWRIFSSEFSCQVNLVMFFNVPEDWAEIFGSGERMQKSKRLDICEIFTSLNPFFRCYSFLRVEVGVFDRYEKWDMQCNKCNAILRRERIICMIARFRDHSWRLHIIFEVEIFNVFKVRFVLWRSNG